MDITAVIPHARDISLLWSTYACCQVAGIRNIVIVANGQKNPRDYDKFDAYKLFDSKHLGPARAREWGARYVGTDWIFFIDDDSVFDPRMFDDVPQADCVFYPSTCWGDVYHHDYDIPQGDWLLAESIKKPRGPWPYPCFAAAAGQMLIRKSVWDEVGGHGGDIDGYGPDELSLGYRLKGKNVIMDPRFPVWHYPSHEDYKNRDQAFLDRFRRAEEKYGSRVG